MADDFVKEEVEDYKEEDNHFHSSVAQGFDTDEISFSDVNSPKNSLAIIYICLKMYCYKYAC